MLHQAPTDALDEHQNLLRRCAEVALDTLTKPGDSEPLSLEAEKTFLEAVKTYDSSDAPLRLINLIRYKIGKHTRRTWIVLEAWRSLHPGCITTLIIVGVLFLMALLRMSGAV